MVEGSGLGEGLMLEYSIQGTLSLTILSSTVTQNKTKTTVLNMFTKEKGNKMYSYFPSSKAMLKITANEDQSMVGSLPQG